MGQAHRLAQDLCDGHPRHRGAAMARMVSGTVSLAVEAVQSGRFGPGVHAAPADSDLVEGWLSEIGTLAQHLRIVDRMAR